MTPAAALAREVFRTMVIQRMRSVAGMMLLGALAVGAGVFGSAGRGGESPRASGGRQPAVRGSGTGREDSGLTPAARQKAVSEREPQPGPGRMFVVGKVLAPDGKPVPRAAVMAYGMSKEVDDRPGAQAPGPMGQGACDDAGRFRLEMPRVGSSTHFGVGVAALAPGFGLGWTALPVDAEEPAVEIRLNPEQIIEGRLFDIKGRVAAAVKVTVEGLGHPQHTPEALPLQVEGPFFWGGAYMKAPPAWPQPTATDDEGRFTIRGIGRGVRASIMADAPEYARHRILVDTDEPGRTKRVTEALEPARVILGRVTYGDTGRPVPHAAVEILSYRGGPGYGNDFETDDRGEYRANPLTGDSYHITVYAPRGEPYLNASTGERPFTIPAGVLEHRVDLRLRRGVVIRGRVTEEGTGRPVAGAALRYSGRRTGPLDPADSGSWSGTTQSGPDGSYLVAVHPNPGTLVVLGPSDDYVLTDRGRDAITDGRPGGMRWYAHAFVPCEPKAGADALEANVTLRRGATVKARVIGPDGQPVREAQVFSRTILMPQPVPWRWFWGESHGDVRDGQFEMHGLGPDGEIPAYFLDAKNQLGATAVFSAAAGKDGPITVRLQPCGLAVGRLVDGKGNPLAGHRDPYLIRMLVTPGPARGAADKAQLEADEDYLSRIDPDHYAERISDAQGRITFPALIPGATYRILGGGPGGKEFVAASGQAIELGDIVIAQPR